MRLCLGHLINNNNKTHLSSKSAMANLIRSAESGSHWGINELIAFNIGVSYLNIQTFFGIPNLPQTTVSPVILNNLEEPAGKIRVGFLHLFGRCYEHSSGRGVSC